MVLVSFLSCKEIRDDSKTIFIVEPLDRRTKVLLHRIRIDSLNKSREWKELKCGLYKSKNGLLGFKTKEGTEQGIFIDRYISKLLSGAPLHKIIDTSSFKFLGSSFYKDKNNIYTHYDRADGGSFYIVNEADVNSFKILGDCYAKDKNYIYGERTMPLDSVDYASFKTKKGLGCYAKDKNSYYFWDKKMNKEELNHTDTKEIIIELDKL